MSVNVPASLSKNQYAYLQRTFDSWFNVAEGGKRGGKNVLNTLAFALNLELHPDRLHLIAGVNISAAKINIIDCDGFGLANFFEGRCREGEYKNREALFVKTQSNGEKVVLIAGLGKDREERKIKGMSVGMVYITEANECHPNGLRECFDRTLASKARKIFHDLNPKAEGHFYYKDFLDFHELQQEVDPEYGYNYGHFTIFDNMSLTQEHVDRETAKYDKSSAWFKREILGKRMALEGLVYPMFNKDFHVVPTVPRTYEKYWISGDYGTMNPCALLLWGLSNGVYYLIDEYYHDGRKGEPRTDEEHYDELVKLVDNRPVSRVIIDPSAASFITLIKRKGKFRVREADNAVVDGIRECGTALQQDIIKINDCCKNTITEFGLYSWNSKSTEDKPIKDSDHCMDAIRYLVKTLKITVPKRKGFIIH